MCTSLSLILIKSFDRVNCIGRSIFIVYSGHPPKSNSYLFDCNGKYVSFNEKKKARERSFDSFMIFFPWCFLSLKSFLPMSRIKLSSKQMI